MTTEIRNEVELLEALAAAGAVIRSAEGGRVSVDVDRRTEALRAACNKWKWVLIWGMHGARRGFRWHGCNSCGALAPLAKRAGGPCAMTSGCGGGAVDIPLPRFGGAAVRTSRSASRAAGSPDPCEQRV